MSTTEAPARYEAMSDHYHWNLSADGKTITAYASSGDRHTPIATVENERACRLLLRASQCTEEIERLTDQWKAGMIDGNVYTNEVWLSVNRYIDDTMTREYGKKVPCPQLEEE